MESIMVVLAAIVAALLIGPCVAVGATIDARKVRSQAALLRSRLEAVSLEKEAALFHLGETREALVAKAEELWREKAWARVAHGCSLERGKMIAELKAEIKQLRAFMSEDGVEIEELRDEVEALALSVRGLTADAEGASNDAAALRALNAALMSERGETLKRLNAADRRVKALETFIDRAYGPVNECEIDTRVCTWCETQDLAGGSACEVCDQPF